MHIINIDKKIVSARDLSISQHKNTATERKIFLLDAVHASMQACKHASMQACKAAAKGWHRSQTLTQALHHCDVTLMPPQLAATLPPPHVLP